MSTEPCGHNGLSSDPADYCSHWREMQAEITRLTAELAERDAEVERLKEKNRALESANMSVAVCAEHTSEIATQEAGFCWVCDSDRLRQIIADAPHTPTCQYIHDRGFRCNCWKSAVGGSDG